MFSTIVADPPWRVKAGPGVGDYKVVDGKQVWNAVTTPTRDLAYPSMTVDEIMRLDIPVADNAHLYLWTINAYVHDAYRVAAAWGFKPSTLLVWAKNPFGGGLGGAYGISTEFILFARRGSLPAKRKVKGTWFNWKRPYKNGYPNHSGKPPEAYEMIESVSPGPYLEMFARSPRPGWAVWGNEVESDLELCNQPEGAPCG